MNEVVEGLIDSHAHLDFSEFASELPAVVARSVAAGVDRIVTIGTDLASSEESVGLAERFSEVSAVVGWHPCTALSAPQDIRADLDRLARRPKVVAIGETGLDYHHLPSETEGKNETDDEAYKTAQARLFEQHLEVAADRGLSVVIHQRDAYADTIARWRPYAEKGVRAVFHCFVGSVDEMKEIVSMGGLVSFTGIVTFKNAESVRETVAATPSDRLMLETDCPYLAPVPYRGKRCEPAYVREIAATVAEVKGVEVAELAAVVRETTKAFYRGLS